MPMSCNPTTNKNLQGITLQRTRNFNVALLSKNTAWPTITSASWWIDNLRGYWSNLLMNLTEEMTILWLRLRPCGIMIKIVFYARNKCWKNTRSYLWELPLQITTWQKNKSKSVTGVLKLIIDDAPGCFKRFNWCEARIRHSKGEKLPKHPNPNLLN
jgi:hypothetical protein